MSPTQPEDGVQELSADAHARRINEWMAGFEVSITTAVNSMRVARREAPHPMPPPVRVTVEVGQHPSAERSLRAAVTGDKNGEPTEPKRRSTLKANEHGQYPASAVPVRAPVAGGVVSNPVGPKRRGAPLDAPRQCPAASKSARAAVAGGMVSDPIDLTENDAPEPKRRRTRQYPPTLLPQYQAAVSTVAAPADSPAAAFSSAPTWPYGDLTASMGAHARYGSTGIPTSMPQGVPGMTATAAAPVMPLRTPLSDAPAWSYKYPAALRHRGNAAGGCSFPWSVAAAAAFRGIPAAAILATLRVSYAAAGRSRDPAGGDLLRRAGRLFVSVPATPAAGCDLPATLPLACEVVHGPLGLYRSV